MYGAAGLEHARLFARTVVTTEIHEGASARGHALQLDERAGRPGRVHLHRERPHLHARGVELLQLSLKYRLVEALRAAHVLDVYLEPADRIAFHCVPFEGFGRMKRRASGACRRG